jgi:hypothetical protein|tara:strand:- start:2840 stop:3304 length:465 start_codon:yes stop_codon:yes gene_type:complete
MSKEKKTLMFNAKTGVLLGAMPPSTINAELKLDKFKFKEVELDPINEYWDGDYESGQIKSVDEKPRFSEAGVNGATAASIEAHYPIHKQINIILEMLNQSEVPNTSAFQKMYDYLSEQRELGKQKKKTYQESDAFDYVSENDLQEFAKKAIDFD